MTATKSVAPPKQTKQRSISIVGAILIILYTMLPIAWILSLSLKSPGDLTNKKFWPTHWTLGNYRTVFKTSLFTDALRNSIGISLIATVIGVVVATFPRDPH